MTTAQSPMTFAALPGHSALAVQDLIQSEVFYRQLGFELLWHDSDWAFLLSPQGWGLALLAPSYRGAGPHLGFHVESRADLERMWLDCCAAGARSVGMIHVHRDGSSSFYACDPDGNVLEWVQEPDGGLLPVLKAMRPS